MINGAQFDGTVCSLQVFLKVNMAKLGSKNKPAILRVQDLDTAAELMQICSDNDWECIVGIESDQPEDISDLNRLLNPSRPFVKANHLSIGRNDHCPCGSGKKFKKCCLA